MKTDQSSHCISIYKSMLLRVFSASDTTTIPNYIDREKEVESVLCIPAKGNY